MLLVLLSFNLGNFAVLRIFLQCAFSYDLFGLLFFPSSSLCFVPQNAVLVSDDRHDLFRLKFFHS